MAVPFYVVSFSSAGVVLADDPAGMAAPDLALGEKNLHSQPELSTDALPISATDGPIEDPVLAYVGDDPVHFSDLGFPLGSFPTRDQIADALRVAVRERVTYLASLRAGYDAVPSVVQQIAKLRRSIMGSKFLEAQLALRAPIPTENDVSEFIAKNPDFFADRQVYRFSDVLVLTPTSDDIVRVTSEVQNYAPDREAQQSNASNFIEWLGGKGYKFQRSVVSRGSEEIDEKIYKVIRKLDKIGYAVLPDEKNQQIRAIFLHGATPEPVNADLVRENVRAGLLVKARARALEEFVNDLVSKADIKFIDENLELSVLTSPSVAPGSSVGPAGTAVTTRDRFYVSWLSFVAVVGSFLCGRMILLARQLWAVADDRSSLRGKVAIFLPVLAAAVLFGSSALYLLYRSDIIAQMFDVALLPNLLAGLIGGLFIASGAYMLSIMDKPYLRCGVALALLVTCQAVILGKAIIPI